jgi:hypothetical protein
MAMMVTALCFGMALFLLPPATRETAPLIAN